MTKAVILINMPAPYRVGFFHYMQTHFPDYELHILYASRGEDDRGWTLDESLLLNTHFSKARTIRIPRRMDDKYIHLPADVAAQLDALDPDVVVAQEYNPSSLQALRWARRHRRPFVSWTDGTLHSERDINALQRYFRRRIIGRAASFIASSSKSREAQIAYGADPARIHISYLTVDIDRYLTENRRVNDHTLLYVGRLSHQKGLDLLFNALARVRKSYALRVVGGGKDEAAIRAAARDAGVADHVTFLPFMDTDALVGEYARASAFVLPSRDDCYGLVPLEAMCAGLPVLCSRYADGAWDQVDEGVTGYIVDPEDAEGFAARIETLLGDGPLLDRMGSAGCEKARSFRWAHTAPPFLAAIDEARA